ncbi:hypothetical protein M569_10402 [Genlisea aurea]|uniref:non-specific serine/threonine protein kinase n=1 Tax=Genlisea aurea TaxID=192259 RepID=S8DWY2_9LAMI|nr:hypothetical protein M569_10402 [Genlisea aurea]
MDSDGIESEIEEKSPCGRYVRYGKIIGRGAFKDVYRGLDLFDNSDIAWCQISIDDDKSLQSLISGETQWFEAVLLNSLHHENIIKCYSHWIDPSNGCVNMITELFASGNLRHYMKKLAAVDQKTIKNWGRQILHAVAFLHARNPKIVHRDLKCDNVFVDPATGEVKLGDFGLAAVMEETPMSALAGTPEFMAPEYYDEEYGELVDVYSFGMCLLEMSTFECPYSECTNQGQIFKKVSSGILPRALGKVDDPEVKEIIEKCLLPADSRPSAAELLKHPFFAEEEQISYAIGDVATTAKADVMMTMLSDVSTVYNPVSDASFEGKKECCWDSDVSMDSRITCESL